MDGEADEIPREELYDDKYYNLILPDNSRVQAKLRSRADYEAKFVKKKNIEKNVQMI